MKTKIEPSALLTYILVILFGSSSWISVNGTWIQLPLMVNILPEGWTLPSYLAIIVQLAFIGPLFYAIAKKLFPYVARRSPRLTALSKSNFGRNFTPIPLIYATLIIAVLCHLLLAIFWHRTTVWSSGVEHSTTLFILFFFVSMVNCLSNVLYLPYMFRFRPTYTTAYFIGMGFSALVPSILGLIQGSGRIDCFEKIDNSTNSTSWEAKQVMPLFGVGLFNGLLCIWLSVTVVAFYFLNRLPQLKNERNTNSEGEDKDNEGLNTAKSISQNVSEGNRLSDEAVINTLESEESIVDRHRQSDTLSPCLYLFLLFITAWVCALMNGVLPSIQSFASLPYGQLIYHLAVTISNLANPVACFVPFFIKLRRVGLFVSVWTTIGTLLSAYILSAAVWSPKPLLGSGPGTVGPAFCILSWTLVTGVLAYLRTVIASVLRESGGGGARSENRLFWCGLFTQAGAFVGAVVIFPLINVQQVFKTAPSCGAI